MENPWQIKNDEIKLDTPWIRVHFHEVIDPGGNDGIYAKIHYKKLAVAIIPLDEEYNTWIIGQYRFPLNEYSWEVPEGGAEREEDPLECAKRELSEEAGVTANQWELIQEMSLSNASSDEKGLIYVAKDLSVHANHPDPDEQLEVKKIPFSKLYQMVIDGEITDSLSVAGVLKTKILIDEGKI